MPLSTSYQEYILEKLIKEYLYDGTIPTSDTLEDDLSAYKETHPDLSLPKSKYVDFSVSRGDSSSASTISTIAETFSDDISVITREIYSLAIMASKYQDRWSFEAKRLASKARKLEQRLDSALLLTNNTAGYFATVGETFSDLENVDTENTDANVNIDESQVSIGMGTDTFESVNAIDLTAMTDYDVSFRPLSKRAGTTYFNVSADNSLLQVFKSHNSSWVAKVICATTGQMTCELKAQVSTSVLYVSRISMEYTSPDTTGRSTITALYSLDGYTWTIVPTNEATKPLTDRLSWSFPKTGISWIKFIINRPSHDQGKYEYLFSARSIKLFGDTYSTSVGNTFQSKALSAVNAKNNIVEFSKVQLDSCDNTPTDTEITYYVSASKDNSTWTSWNAISPSDTEGIKYPKVISFGGASYTYNTDSSAETLNSSYETDDIVTTFDDSYVVTYKFKTNKFCAVNTKIEIQSGDDPDVVSNSISVWRNTRVTDSYPDTSTVRGIPRGWGTDEGETYICYFEIFDSNGKFLDFGDKLCVLDGELVSGVVSVSKGVHKFETAAENWFDIAEGYNALGYDLNTEEVLKTIDPLYPYNHKLVIEGFPYSNNFKGDKVYKGTDISAEFYCTRASLFDLENNISDYGYYAVRGIGASDINQVVSVILQYDPKNTDFVNEKVLLKWKTAGSESSAYKYVKLKAVLSTSDSSLTPTITSYRIKLGV